MLPESELLYANCRDHMLQRLSIWGSGPPPWQSCRFRKGGGAAWFPIQGGQLVLSQANLLGSPLGLGGGFCAPQRPVAVSDTPCAKELFLWPVKSKGLAILCDSGFFLRQSSVHFHLSAFPYTPAHAECLSK